MLACCRGLAPLAFHRLNDFARAEDLGVHREAQSAVVDRPAVFREGVLKIPKPRKQLLDEQVQEFQALRSGDGPPKPRGVDAPHGRNACAVNGFEERGDVPFPQARRRGNMTLGEFFPVVGVVIPRPALGLTGRVHKHVVLLSHLPVKRLHEVLLLALEMVREVRP